MLRCCTLRCCTRPMILFVPEAFHLLFIRHVFSKCPPHLFIRRAERLCHGNGVVLASPVSMKHSMKMS